MFGTGGPRTNRVEHELEYFDLQGFDGIFMRTANVIGQSKGYHLLDGRVDRYYFRTQFGISVLTVGRGGNGEQVPQTLINNIGGIRLFNGLNERLSDAVQGASE